MVDLQQFLNPLWQFDMILVVLEWLQEKKGEIAMQGKVTFYIKINVLTSLIQVNKSVDRISVSTGSPLHR